MTFICFSLVYANIFVYKCKAGLLLQYIFNLLDFFMVRDRRTDGSGDVKRLSLTVESKVLCRPLTPISPGWTSDTFTNSAKHSASAT